MWTVRYYTRFTEDFIKLLPILSVLRNAVPLTSNHIGHVLCSFVLLSVLKYFRIALQIKM